MVGWQRLKGSKFCGELIDRSVQGSNVGGVFMSAGALGGGVVVGGFGLKTMPNVLKGPTFVHGVIAGVAQCTCAFIPELLSLCDS